MHFTPSIAELVQEYRLVPNLINAKKVLSALPDNTARSDVSYWTGVVETHERVNRENTYELFKAQTSLQVVKSEFNVAASNFKETPTLELATRCVRLAEIVLDRTDEDEEDKISYAQTVWYWKGILRGMHIK